MFRTEPEYKLGTLPTNMQEGIKNLLGPDIQDNKKINAGTIQAAKDLSTRNRRQVTDGSYNSDWLE